MFLRSKFDSSTHGRRISRPLTYLKLRVECLAQEHVPNIGDRGVHTFPDYVVSLICQVLGEVEGITIIYNVGPEQ